VVLRDEAAILGAATDPERVYVEELLPRKTKAYVDYVRNRSCLGDLAVLVATVKEVVRPIPRTDALEDLV
jgi:lipopolysaccharide/colanic/teichoic acid biosynthesis glycosyltransferase